MGKAFLNAYRSCSSRPAAAAAPLRWAAWRRRSRSRAMPKAFNEAAFAKVRADKEREAGNGHDGTWVAHPDLVQVTMEVFDRLMPGPKPTREKA